MTHSRLNRQQVHPLKIITLDSNIDKVLWRVITRLNGLTSGQRIRDTYRILEIVNINISWECVTLNGITTIIERASQPNYKDTNLDLKATSRKSKATKLGDVCIVVATTVCFKGMVNWEGWVNALHGIRDRITTEAFFGLYVLAVDYLITLIDEVRDSDLLMKDHHVISLYAESNMQLF